MKLGVPFYLQDNKVDCGPVALRMVLDYFGADISARKVLRAVDGKPGKGTWTIQLATASAELGYRAEFYSRQIGFNEANLQLEFYRKYADLIADSKRLIEKAKGAGVGLKEQTISLERLVNQISRNCLAIVLIDWNIVTGKKDKGYQGHFVPLIGYDNNSVIIHNPGKNNPKKNLHIPRKVFDRARKAKGTDEDIVFIHRR